MSNGWARHCFDSVKTKPSTFWCGDSASVVVLTTMAAALAIVTGGKISMSWLGWIGFVVWLFGFAVEVVADAQKSSFKNDPVNKGQFIRTDFGLGLATPITLEKLFFGLEWPSWRFPFLRAGNMPL